MSTSSANIVHAGIPSRSALRVATLRAAHQLLDEPLIFKDPVALPILGKELEATLQDNPFQFNDPMSRGMRASLVARSMYAEDELKKAVENGVRQYVVLGAGLDTFAYRNPFADQELLVYEVDHPSTQLWKQALLDEAGVPLSESVKFVACDFEGRRLSDCLRAAGFRMDAPACFSWLGVTVYLSEEAIFETLRFVASLPKGSAVTFDYRQHAAQLHPIENFIGEFIGRQFAEQGEPWISCFDSDSLRKILLEMGFESVEDVGPADINPRYFARRKDGLQTGGGFRLMCAKT